MSGLGKGQCIASCPHEPPFFFEFRESLNLSGPVVLAWEERSAR